jgi:hypothetical protein
MSKKIFAIAALAASIGGVLAIGSGARATEASPYASSTYCAGGYHIDPDGSCQPNNGYIDNRCPPGFNPHPYPNGNNNICVPVYRGG